MKLYSFIYKNGQDCSLGGYSSKCNNSEIRFKSERTSTIDAKGFTETEAKSIAILLDEKNEPDCLIAVEDICCGTRRVRAIPTSLIRSGVWTMFGGNFIYTSDSRGFEHPIKIYDRVEDSNR
jgi:hypothetical protein